ncbi:MAG TPA: LPXTG cell wall anchor domain-containing protein [Rhodanobacteraceae bacterium]|nr:LPXTG cell wall anchor domain-containing protein [Rhodanobacteraceae bacterium]
MKTKPNVMIAMALATASLAWAGGAFAQQTMNPAAAPEPAVNAESCAQMNWNPDLLAQYPWVTDACQEVIVVNGEKYARFEGHVVRHFRDGSFKTQFVDRSGKHNEAWGYMDLKPAPGQHVYLAGETANFNDLPTNQVLNFYVPANVLGVAEQPGGAVAEIVQEPQGQQVASALPQTASSLPAIALGGLISLLGALGLAIRRRLA